MKNIKCANVATRMLKKYPTFCVLQRKNDEKFKAKIASRVQSGTNQTWKNIHENVATSKHGVNHLLDDFYVTWLIVSDIVGCSSFYVNDE